MSSSDRSLLRAPLPADWTVARGLEEYLAENGFDRALYDAAWTPASLLGVRFSVPNTQKHRWAIMRHDLHHVITGYGTDIIGEAEVSAWEMASGLPNIGIYTTGLVSGLALLGYTRFPSRTLAARRAATGETMYHDRVGYDAALAMRIGELRARFRIPERGIADGRALHAGAP